MGSKRKRQKKLQEVTFLGDEQTQWPEVIRSKKLEMGTSFDCLPSAIFAKQYEELVPGAAKEILEMAKANNAANIERDKSDAENVRTFLHIISKGQVILAFVISGLVGTMFYAVHLHEQSGVWAIAVAITGLGYFMWKPTPQDKDHKDSERK